MLIIVKHRNLHRFTEHFFDVETFRSLDVFQIDSSKRRFQQLAQLDHVFRIVTVDLKVKHVNVCKPFEQDSFPLHYWLARQCADIPQAEDGRSIADHRDKVSSAGVFECVVRILLDFEARNRHARGIGQAEVALCPAGLGGRDFNLSGALPEVVVESLLSCNRHIAASDGRLQARQARPLTQMVIRGAAG